MIGADNPLKGRGYTIWTDGDAVLIKYGVMYYGFLGTKRVPVANITALNWREPGSWTVGHLEIAILGEARPPAHASPNVQNQNRLSFESAARDGFAALRDWIQERMAGKPAASAGGVADEIAKLGELVRQGLLTEDEFASQKAKLLS